VRVEFGLGGSPGWRDRIWSRWDNPTMATTTADAKKRVVLPATQPGNVYEVQNLGEGRLLLVRLQLPAPPPRMSRSRCLAAIAASPLRLTLSWEELRARTREP
jgi:hypothetical protein